MFWQRKRPLYRACPRLSCFAYSGLREFLLFQSGCLVCFPRPKAKVQAQLSIFRPDHNSGQLGGTTTTTTTAAAAAAAGASASAGGWLVCLTCVGNPARSCWGPSLCFLDLPGSSLQHTTDTLRKSWPRSLCCCDQAVATLSLRFQQSGLFCLVIEYSQRTHRSRVCTPRFSVYYSDCLPSYLAVCRSLVVVVVFVSD